MSKKSFTLDSDFYCVFCGNKGIKIPRRGGRKRKAGHLKKLFCLYCGRETNMCEVEENTHFQYSDFLLEFNYGNYDKEGNRALPYGLFRAKLNNEGVNIHQYEKF